MNLNLMIYNYELCLHISLYNQNNLPKTHLIIKAPKIKITTKLSFFNNSLLFLSFASAFFEQTILSFYGPHIFYPNLIFIRGKYLLQSFFTVSYMPKRSKTATRTSSRSASKVNIKQVSNTKALPKTKKVVKAKNTKVTQSVKNGKTKTSIKAKTSKTK